MNPKVHKLTVHRCDSAELRLHVEQYHYLHHWPDPRSLPFGYLLKVDDGDLAADGRLNGLVVMKKPQHHRQARLFGYPGFPTSWQVLDVARIWVNPQWQAHVDGHALCFVSQMLSKVVRRVQADWLEHHPPRFPNLPYHVTLIISYCELSHHDGVAYRASGFTSAGLTQDKSKELYIRRLRAPLKAWTPSRPVQWPLLEGFPIHYA